MWILSEPFDFTFRTRNWAKFVQKQDCTAGKTLQAKLTNKYSTSICSCTDLPSPAKVVTLVTSAVLQKP